MLINLIGIQTYKKNLRGPCQKSVNLKTDLLG